MTLLWCYFRCLCSPYLPKRQKVVPIALVEEGDIIGKLMNTRRVELHVPEEELQRRKAARNSRNKLSAEGQLSRPVFQTGHIGYGRCRIWN